jgi:hypothetical protein
VVLLGAGLTQYGCQAAAEFVTNPKSLTDALKALPQAWKDRNVEFVLKIAVVGKTPSAPAAVASHSW